VYGDTGVLSPTKLFHVLSHKYPLEFNSMLGLDKAHDFWLEHRPSDPKFAGNPMLDVPDWQRIFKPMWIHGGQTSHLSF
jgi:hypothetical protein